MGCRVSSYRVGGGMTSSTISVNFNDTAQKTVFTATEKCILKLTAEKSNVSNRAKLKLNNTDLGQYEDTVGTFVINQSIANTPNILMPNYNGTNGNLPPSALILYLEEGDTVYATRTSSNAFTATFYSAVFTF